MFNELMKKAYKANMMLREYGLAPFTWGNASQICPERKYVAIKPSGVRYEDMAWDMMCVLRLDDGTPVDPEIRAGTGESDVVTGRNEARGSVGVPVRAGTGEPAGVPVRRFAPSTDAPTHLEIYRRFPGVGGVAHTHSAYATAFAQADRRILCYGTTHADYFYGEIPCTRALSADEIDGEYELNTGRVIAETFAARAIDPLAVPGALVCRHGPFTWGKSAEEAASNAAYLEESARLAYLTLQIAACPEISYDFHDGTFRAAPAQAPGALLDKHYNRKHGANAYYGQSGQSGPSR